MTNFLDLGVNYSNSKVAILPIPYEETTSYRKGTKQGPEAILDASFELETFDIENRKEPYLVGIHTFPKVTPKKTPLLTFKEISKKVEKAVKDDKFLISLGGEHTITQAIIPAFKKKYPNLSILQIDAHADLKDKFDKTKYSHACTARRIYEICPNLTQVGIRSLDKNEYKFIIQNKIRTFFMENLRKNRRLISAIIPNLTENVYITLDVDALDPSIMPSTGTPEPGGLYYYEVLRLLKEIFKHKNVVGMDIVELSPQKDNPAPEFTIAKLIYKAIGYKFNGKN